MNEFINIGWAKDEISKKIANEFPHGSYVNLGIGMPELVSKFVAVSYTHLTLPTISSV